MHSKINRSRLKVSPDLRHSDAFYQSVGICDVAEIVEQFDAK